MSTMAKPTNEKLQFYHKVCKILADLLEHPDYNYVVVPSQIEDLWFLLARDEIQVLCIARHRNKTKEDWEKPEL